MRMDVDKNTTIVPDREPSVAMAEEDLRRGRGAAADILEPSFGNNSEVDGK
jgi:hypothetical protein